MNAACEGRDPVGRVDRVPHEDDAERDHGGQACIAKTAEAGGRCKLEVNARAIRRGKLGIDG